jgi:hypothetical protein
MQSYPHVVDRLHEGGALLVGDFNACMPPSAAIDHVEDDMFPVEEQIKLYLFVKGVRQVDAYLIVRSRPHPFATRRASVHDFLDEVQRTV